MHNGRFCGSEHEFARGILTPVNLLSAIFRLLIRLYRWTVSPMQRFVFGPGCGCRFSPTCSEYADEALRTHGFVAGSWLALKRLVRCHPWGGCGCDPVPAKPYHG